VGRARRNDRGPQKGGDPTFINALVNGEVAPKPAVPGTVGRPKKVEPETIIWVRPGSEPSRPLTLQRHFRLGRIRRVRDASAILTPGLADPGLHPDYIFRRSATA
jgi:hypothetical protein